MSARSAGIARNPSHGTKPETLLRSALWRRGLRYRLEYKTEWGRPDLTFLGPKVAIFIDGCFWHGCPEHYVRPRTREAFWQKKLKENVNRDRRQILTFALASFQGVTSVLPVYVASLPWSDSE